MQNVQESLWRILLTQCPALETGCFSFAERSPFEETLSTVDVTLRRLKSLTIKFVHPLILDGIRFPALRDLSLYMIYTETFAWTAPEHMFFQLAPATKLTLGAQVSAQNIINLFRATTNVTGLSTEFDVLPSTDGFTALALGGGSNEILLPKLDMIWVEMSSTYGREASAISALVKMAASRSPSDAGALGVVPLREVLEGSCIDLCDAIGRRDSAKPSEVMTIAFVCVCSCRIHVRVLQHPSPACRGIDRDLSLLSNPENKSIIV